ncbi:Alg9-like mannosyltransferase family-domain-containing protein [Gorgonomyces haynaldii]|nr:Alg9-like mannosyltransferase family-domain-containing protein [Gorgonomyces haynaldii]
MVGDSDIKIDDTRWLLVFALLFRVTNALWVETYFDPDEYWQSLEVGHFWIFGNGYLTWEWTAQIRSFAHPLLFAGVYSLLKFVGLAETDWIVYGPKVFQGLLSGLCDYLTHLLAKRVYGPDTGRWTFILTTLSWFHAYCLVRTYSNSLETILTVCGLYFWPLPRSNNGRDLRISFIFAGLSCIIRPTNALFWIYLGLNLIYTFPERFFTILFDTLVIGMGTIWLEMIINYQFFGKWVWTPFNFLRVNVLEGISLFYGTQPFYFYFLVGLPVVLLTMLPIVAYGVLKTNDRHKLLYFNTCVFVVCVLSLLGHKEFRFLMPIVPLCLVYGGYGMHNLKLQDQKRNRTGTSSLLNRVILLLLLTHLPLMYYTTRVHKRGQVQVTGWLRKEARLGNIKSVLFLTPCHSTPFYSHVHLNVPMRQLTCEPPLRQSISKREKRSYLGEDEIFYLHPERFLISYFNQTQPKIPAFGQQYYINTFEWPSHIVWFDNQYLNTVLPRYLTQYRECLRLFNSHFHDDSKRRGDLVVSCL